MYSSGQIFYILLKIPYIILILQCLICRITRWCILRAMYEVLCYARRRFDLSKFQTKYIFPLYLSLDLWYLRSIVLKSKKFLQHPNNTGGIFMSSKLVKSDFLLNVHNDAASIKCLRKRLMVFLPLIQRSNLFFMLPLR